MKFVVMQDRVLAEKVTGASESKSEFYVPESVDKKWMEAIIVEIGQGLTAGNFKAGDKVFMAKTSGFQFKHEGKEYVMAHVNEIMAKIVD